jgi:hypothetical protein
MEKAEIMKAVENDTLYDLIAGDAYRMSKDQLATIAKEALFAYRQAKKRLPAKTVESIDHDFHEELDGRVY